MRYHKWKGIERNEEYHKIDVCQKCGITRAWLGGVWQCWEYWLPEWRPGGRETLIRPDCKNQTN